jgi:hypothetical protein
MWMSFGKLLMRWTADPPSPRLRRDKNLRRSFGYSLIVVGQQKRSFRETTGQRDYRAKRGRYQMSHVRGQQKAKSWEMRAKPLRQDGDSVTRRYHLGKRPPCANQPSHEAMARREATARQGALALQLYNKTEDGGRNTDVRCQRAHVRRQGATKLRVRGRTSG